MNFALPIALAVLGAVCLAWSSVLQHEGVGRAGAGAEAVRGRVVAGLARDRAWLTGTALLVLGVGLHFTAVTLAPVSLVQPVGVLAVPLTVHLAARRAGRTDPRYASAWVAVVGTVGLVAVTSRAVSVPHGIDPDSVTLVAAALLPLAGVLALLGLRGPAARRGLALAASAGAAYGLATALVRGIAVLVQNDGFAHPAQLAGLAALIAACYAVGCWLVQQAYLVGTAETVMGTLTVVDPLVAVVVGLATLGEGATVGLGSWFGMVACAAVAVAGVAALSRPGATDDPASGDDGTSGGSTAAGPHHEDDPVAASDAERWALSPDAAVVWAPDAGFAPSGPGVRTT